MMLMTENKKETFDYKKYKQTMTFEFKMENVITSLNCLTPLQKNICLHLYVNANDFLGKSQNILKVSEKPCARYLANTLNVNYYDMKKHLKKVLDLPFIYEKHECIFFAKPSLKNFQDLNVSLSGKVSYEKLEKTQPVVNKKFVINISKDIFNYFTFIFTSIDQLEAARTRLLQEDKLNDLGKVPNYNILPKGTFITLNFSNESNHISRELARKQVVSGNKVKVFSSQKTQAKTYVFQKQTTSIQCDELDIATNYTYGSIFIEVHQSVREHKETRGERYKLYRDSVKEVSSDMVPRFEDKKLTKKEKEKIHKKVITRREKVISKNIPTTFSNDVKEVVNDYEQKSYKRDGTISYKKLTESVKSILARSGEKSQFGVNSHGEITRIKNLVSYLKQYSNFYRYESHTYKFILWTAFKFKDYFKSKSRSENWYPELVAKVAAESFTPFQSDIIGKIDKDFATSTLTDIDDKTREHINDFDKLMQEKIKKERRKKEC